MKGDFSRWNRENKNFNGVLHQQGRVLLDSDWNAAARINNARQDQAGRDAVGPGAAAVPSEVPDSFKVEAAEVVTAGTDRYVELDILPGRVWADGVLTYLTGKEGDPAAVVKRRAEYIGPPFTDTSLTPGVRDAVILEVWREAVNGFQVPGELIEPALGGPDTTERVHTAFAFKLLPLAPTDRCENLPGKLKDDLSKKGSLRVTLDPAKTVGGECPVEEGGGYTGFEHYLYRIEIAEPDTGVLGISGPMFKWSRFNGGLVGRAEFDAITKTAAITANFQAVTTCGLSSFYLEVVQYDEDLGHWTVTYGTDATLNADNELDLAGPPRYGTMPSAGESVFFRLWDGIKPIKDFPLATAAVKAGHLENGIRFEFDNGGKIYNPGDYWIFELRSGGIGNPPVSVPVFSLAPALETGLIAETNSPALQAEFSGSGFPISTEAVVEEKITGSRWQITDPEKEETYLVKKEGTALNVYHMTLLKLGPPDGILYHRVPLAILKWNGETEIDERAIHDCRRVFRPLIDWEGCCTFTVGKGGNFPTLQRAVDHLPASGGIVCLMPGIYEESVIIRGKENIVIRGCDRRTVLVPTEREPKKTIFSIIDSREITLEHMDMEAYGGTAVHMEGSEPGKLHGIHVRNNRILACTHAVCAEEGERVHIVGNTIRMLDREDGDVAVFMDADDSLIEDNDITVVPRDEFDPGIDIPGVDVFPNPAEPCIDLGVLIKYRPLLQMVLNRIWLFAFKASPFTAEVPVLFSTPGGIRIAGNSMSIRIRRNRISGGSGNGITLGNIPKIAAPQWRPYRNYYYIDELVPPLKAELKNAFSPFIYDLEIEENRIRYMGLNGIGMVNFFSLEKIGVMVSIEDMTVYRNIIEECLQQVSGRVPTAMNMEMGIGGISLADVENLVVRENRIENNGTGQPEPVSGIFILHGEKIDISDNRILNNGSRTGEGPGMRGGIVIASSFRRLMKEAVEESENGIEPLHYDGIPAAKIHDNIVTQPLGQALFIMALGPVSVIGNHFTSQIADYRFNPLSLPAGAVTIVNLGASKDLVGRLLFPSYKRVAGFNSNIDEAKQAILDQAAAGSGADSAGSASDSAETVDFITAGAFYDGRYVQDSAQPYPGNIQYFPGSVIPGQILDTLRHLPSGNVLFANNQTVLDLRSTGPGTPGIGLTGMFALNSTLGSIFIASLDDVSFTGNQSECTASTETVISNAVVVGVTVRTNDNRFQEGSTHSFFSLVSLGFMNTAAANQSTHCLMVLGPPAFTKNLISNTSFSGPGTCKTPSGWLRQLFNIPAPPQTLTVDTQGVLTLLR